jgi:hypothetical protein
MKDKKDIAVDVLEIANEKKDIVPMDKIDFEEDANAGLETADKSSFAIPFITLLQGLSPQLKDVEGARPGLFINTITNEIFTEVQVIPCAFQRVFIRWGSRATGGGYKGQYSAMDIEMKKIDYQEDDSGAYISYKIGDDDLIDTRSHFVLYKTSDDIWKPAIINLSSTQIKKSRRWMTLIQGIEMRTAEGKIFTPPSFSHRYVLRSVEERNSKGSWNSFDISLHSALKDAEVYTKAKAFHKSVMACEIEISTPPDNFEEQSQNSETF